MPQPDIRADGTLDSQANGSKLMNSAQQANLETVRTNLAARYDALGVAATIADFESQVAHFVASSGYAATEQLEYPAEGAHGANVLAAGVDTFEAGTAGDNIAHPDAVAFTTGTEYALAATVPERSEVWVAIVHSETWDEATSSWSCDVPQAGGEHDWQSGLVGGTEAEGIHYGAIGAGSPDMACRFVGEGQADVSVEELGEAPVYKTISWGP